MAGIDSDLIRGHIDTIILNILAEGDRYGYEICKEVENKSKGSYELKQPTLYSCLKRLESQGLISSYWEDSDIGGKRHYYKLTDEGRDTFKQSQDDWRRSREIIDNLISGSDGDENDSNLSNIGDAKSDENTANAFSGASNAVNGDNELGAAAEAEADNSATYDDGDATAANTNVDDGDATAANTNTNNGDAAAANTNVDNGDAAGDNASVTPYTDDEDYIDPAADDTMIFDEIDKEVAEQDSGFIPNDAEPKYINSQPDPAQENGFETEDSTILPFDETDLSAYCSHLVRNGDLQAKQDSIPATNDGADAQDDLISYAKAAAADSANGAEFTADNIDDTKGIEDNFGDTEDDAADAVTEAISTTDDDDIMALLGHTPTTFSARTSETREDDIAAENDEADHTGETNNDNANDAGSTDLTETNVSTAPTSQNAGLTDFGGAPMAQANTALNLDDASTQDNNSALSTQASEASITNEAFTTNANDASNANDATSQEDQFLAKFITGKYSEYNPDREEMAAELAVAHEAKAQDQGAQISSAVSEDNAEASQFVTSDAAEFNDADEFGDYGEETANIESFFDATETNVPQTDANDLSDLHLDNAATTDAASEYTFGSNPISPYSTINIDGESANNENGSSEYAADGNFGSQPTYNFDQSVYSPLGSNFGERKKANENDFTPRGVMNNFADKYDAPKPTGDDEVLLDFSTPAVDSDDEIVMDFSTNFGDDTNSTFGNARDDRDANDSTSNADDYSNAYAAGNDDDYNNSGDYGNDQEPEYSSFMNDLNDQGIDPKDVKPFENKVDLTAVYDKTGSSPISPLYTDSDTKRKLQEITGNTFNADLFGDQKTPEKNDLSVDETLDPSPIDANTTPKDLSLLKSDLNQEGINVRPYYRAVKEPVSSKTFIETNKIKMVRNWIVFFIQALLLGLTYLITSKLNLLDGTVLGTYIYFIVGAGVMLLIAFISTIKFWINPYKKVTAKYAPRISHLFALLFTVQFYVIIYCINLQFGFYSFTQTDYNHLNWIIPCVICLSPIIGSIVYQILYRSKNFHI